MLNLCFVEGAGGVQSQAGQVACTRGFDHCYRNEIEILGCNKIKHDVHRINCITDEFTDYKYIPTVESVN
ncbi:hypothetical protein MAR_016967 [Mya arenaria]|uniref:Uncharacterized protein n=1 Tax=Mya arenaria TaxID=6604 RepID=A0ABY7EF15_MYAAR|nr:hypothetical protein MAR_016967 [Mya arenaria]